MATSGCNDSAFNPDFMNFSIAPITNSLSWLYTKLLNYFPLWLTYITLLFYSPSSIHTQVVSCFDLVEVVETWRAKVTPWCTEECISIHEKCSQRGDLLCTLCSIVYILDTQIQSKNSNSFFQTFQMSNVSPTTNCLHLLILAKQRETKLYSVFC